MIHILELPPEQPREKRIAAVIDEFGAWKVLRVALKALLPKPRVRSRTPRAEDLTDHLRRDIGLASKREADPFEFRSLDTF